MARTNSKSGGLSGNYLRGVRKCALLRLHIKTALSLERAKTCHIMGSQCLLLLQPHFSFLPFPSRGAFLDLCFAGRRPIPVSHHSQPKEKGMHWCIPFWSPCRYWAGCWQSTGFLAAGKPKVCTPPFMSYNVALYS